MEMKSTLLGVTGHDVVRGIQMRRGRLRRVRVGRRWEEVLKVSCGRAGLSSGHMRRGWLSLLSRIGCWKGTSHGQIVRRSEGLARCAVAMTLCSANGDIAKRRLSEIRVGAKPVTRD